MAACSFLAATVLLALAALFMDVGGGALVAARLIGFAIFATIYCIASVGIFIFLMVRLRRLIIGANRLQLLSDVGRIIGQLPYDNILDVKMNGNDVNILLDSLRRKDTWWPRWADDRSGYHIQLTAGFETDAVALRLLLRNAVLAYRQKHGSRGMLS